MKKKQSEVAENDNFDLLQYLRENLSQLIEELIEFGCEMKQQRNKQLQSFYKFYQILRFTEFPLLQHLHCFNQNILDLTVFNEVCKFSDRINNHFCINNIKICDLETCATFRQSLWFHNVFSSSNNNNSNNFKLRGKKMNDLVMLRLFDCQWIDCKSMAISLPESLEFLRITDRAHSNHFGFTSNQNDSNNTNNAQSNEIYQMAFETFIDSDSDETDENSDDDSDLYETPFLMETETKLDTAIENENGSRDDNDIAASMPFLLRAALDTNNNTNNTDNGTNTNDRNQNNENDGTRGIQLINVNINQFMGNRNNNAYDFRNILNPSERSNENNTEASESQRRRNDRSMGANDSLIRQTENIIDRQFYGMTRLLRHNNAKLSTKLHSLLKTSEKLTHKTQLSKKKHNKDKSTKRIEKKVKPESPYYGKIDFSQCKKLTEVC